MKWDDDSRPVRQERSNWRDEAISKRHRQWAFNLPIADVDFLVCEYDRCCVVALVEYKNQHASKDLSNASIRALTDLADCAQKPFFVVRYTDDLSRYCVIPINYIAKERMATWVVMSEVEYVSFLYRLRGREIPTEVYSKLQSRAAA